MSFDISTSVNQLVKITDFPVVDFKQRPKNFVIVVVFGALIICYSYNFVTVDFQFPSFLNSDKTKLKKTKFVSVCNVTFNSRRTGNMLFMLAALLYASELTGRKPIMPESFPYAWINHIFVNDLPRFPNGFIYDPNNSIIISESKPGQVFDEQFRNNLLNKSMEKVTTILICGYFQSYRYVVEVEEELRSYLKFKNDILRSVDEYMRNETVDTPNIIYVGVHVRRTDFITSANSENGRLVVDETYINSTMKYVIESLGASRQFVAFVCSDDINWVRNAVQKLNFSYLYPNLEVVYSVGHDPAFDLCLLSKCNASIISTGSYSWWAGWLANAKITAYYSLFPKPGSVYRSYFNSLNFYPSTWKGFPELNNFTLTTE